MKLAIQHLEPNGMGLGLPDTWFFTAQPEDLDLANNSLPIILPRGTSYTTGTLRNSLFTQCLSKLNGEYTLSLDIRAKGSFTAIVYCQHASGKIERVATKRFTDTSQGGILSFATLPNATNIGRYFYDIESRGAIIYSVSYSIEIDESKIRPTIYLLRTFGNTSGIINSLKRLSSDPFWENYEESKNQLLSNSLFCIYDSTPDSVELLSRELEQLNLNSFAWTGPNLGGGGNASLNLYLAKNYLESSESIFHENKKKWDYVILDDDVCASSETIYRTFAFNQIRSTNITFGSPIFMQSDPQRMWENGGYWGKEFSLGLSETTSVTPQLVHHGMYFQRYEHLNTVMQQNTIDYTTFNLFSLSSETQQSIGYPAAFFLRGDDIDYSIRCKSKGTLITTPNLTVWQEPAHSYWQEYMAFMHGIIINIIHGDWGAREIQSQLQSKVLEHAVHNDFFGVSLYSKIIHDFTTCDLLLTVDFANLYLSRKKEFGAYERQFSADIDPEKSTRKDEIQTISFVSPSSLPDYSKSMVALCWPSNKAFYIYKRNDPSITLAVGAKVMSSMERLQGTDTITEAIGIVKTRYERSIDESFWKEVLSNHYVSLACGSDYIKPSSRNISAIDNRDEDYLGQNEYHESSTTSPIELNILRETFDPQKYLRLNPDVASANIDPLEHYLKYGRKEGRSIA